MRRKPETPWWLRRPNPNASSAPPLPPEAVRYLQEEDKRRWAHIEALHQKYAVPDTQTAEAITIAESTADDAALSPASLEPAAPSEPVTAIANPVATNEVPPGYGSPAPDASPSNAPPSIDQTLDAIAQFIRRYLVCSDHQLTLLVLWIVHTYCFDYFAATPYLNIVSPENQSGKTVCLQLLNLLSCKPWMPNGVTKSRIMGRIANAQPTLLLDDWNTVFRSSSSLSPDAQPIIGFLNAGSTGGNRNAPRPENDDSPLIFCPKAFAGLGCLPASLADRCVPISLQRKKPKDSVHPFWLDVVRPEASRLVEPIPAWVGANWEPLRLAACDLLFTRWPEFFTMRQREFVAPLLAIGQVAGRKWLRKARIAVGKVFNTGPFEPTTIGLQLLTDIRAYFAQEHDPPKIHTAKLLKHLNFLEDRPWKKLTPRSLGIILRNFPIPRTGSQRIGKDNFKGFTFRHFVESWQRYLPHLSCRRSTQIVNNDAELKDHNLCADATGLQIGAAVPEIGTSESSTGASELSIGTPQRSIGTNEVSTGTNSQAETTIPNVFNVCADQSINSHSFQPEQVSESEQAAEKDRKHREEREERKDKEDGKDGEDQCATALPPLPDP